MKVILGAIVGLASVMCLSALHSSLQAQAPASVWDGVYTADQAKRGEAVYNKDCGPCHGDVLEGNGQTERAQKLERMLPPLAGDVFKGNWNGRPLSDLFDKIRKTMPRDTQEKIAPKPTADVVAYILKCNQFPAGKNELPADASALTEIQFEAVKPK